MQTLRLFVDVARCQSLSAAAKLHGITQSAASQRIQSLEKDLGTQLLDRSVRPVSLTDAGAIYFQGCRELIARAEELEHRVRLAAHDRGTTLKVYAMYSTGIGWVSEVQRRFGLRWPETEIQVHYDRPDAIHRALVRGECDLGLISFPTDWTDVESIVLREEDMVLVCRPDHPLADGLTPVSLGRLTGHRMAGIDLELPLGQRTMRAIKDAGGEPDLIDTFDNIDTLKAAVIEADCFALLPDRCVERESRNGTLCAIEISPGFTRPFGVIYDARKELSHVARAFAEELASSSRAVEPEPTELVHQVPSESMVTAS